MACLRCCRLSKADEQDFHLFPLSFAEFLQLKHGFSKSGLIQITLEGGKECDKHITLLFLEFEAYLVHGGHLFDLQRYEG